MAQELQVRQMWRVVMGNAPGLKAEIAKLHATERAKLALRDFETGERRRARWMDDRGQSVVVPRPSSQADVAGSVAESASSPSQQGDASVSARSATAAAESGDGGRSDDGAMTATPRREPEPVSRGGLFNFGWFTGSVTTAAASSSRTRARSQNQDQNHESSAMQPNPRFTV
jgi:hypothetical protein